MGTPRKAKWYVKNGLATFGPLTSAEMRKLAEEGIITADSLIGKEKGTHWAPATKVKGLFRTTDDDSIYALKAEPPPSPSSQAMPVSPPPEADELAMPLGYRCFVDDDREKKRRKRKWLPNFSVSLFGMTINEGTLATGGLAAGVIVLTVLTCALVSWCPRRSQRLLEARAVTLVQALPAAALVRDDRGGDTLLVKLRLSKRFLKENMGAQGEGSAGKDTAFVNSTDFHLASDGTETTAKGFLAVEERRSPWETLLDPGSPYHIESSLPQVGNAKIDVSGTVKHGTSSGAAAAEGDVTANISGDVKGQVNVKPIAHNLSVTGLRAMRGVDGFAIMGRVDGKLPDDIPVSFEYIGDACKIAWSGPWLGFGSIGGSFQASLAERWYDKTVDVYCIFNRPRGAANLSVRYKDAPPISLSPSLAGPSK